MNRNPALFAQPRGQVSSLIVPRGNASIYDWLEQNNRFIQGNDLDSAWSSDDEDLLMDPLLSGSEEEGEPIAA